MSLLTIHRGYLSIPRGYTAIRPAGKSFTLTSPRYDKDPPRKETSSEPEDETCNDTYLGGRLSDNKDKRVTSDSVAGEQGREQGDIDLMGEMDPRDTIDPREVEFANETRKRDS
jgi:hypothetical protein